MSEASLVCAYLAGRDVGCAGCGYNLRGVGSARCPECAREIELVVAGTESARLFVPAVRLAYFWPVGIVAALAAKELLFLAEALGLWTSGPITTGQATLIRYAYLGAFAIMLTLAITALVCVSRARDRRVGSVDARRWVRGGWWLLAAYVVVAGFWPLLYLL